MMEDRIFKSTFMYKRNESDRIIIFSSFFFYFDLIYKFLVNCAKCFFFHIEADIFK